MSRLARTFAASIVPALILVASAGCSDARLGGDSGIRVPGDSPAPLAKPTNPSSPEIGGAADAGAAPAK